jgi:succinate-acetate transporter protein
MEASSYGPGARPVGREADVAPASATPTPSADPTAGKTAGFWEPANPAPLGLAGFAATTMMLSLINANLISPLGAGAVLGLALAYGGTVQLLAGMWEFRTGNTFGAVAFSSYGGFWLSLFFLIKFFPATFIHDPHGMSAYLWIWGGFTLYMFFASLRTTGAIALVFLLLWITYFLLAIGDMGSTSATVTHWGGYVGIATAAAAYYASFAQVINSTFGRVVLPLVPLAVRPAAH